MNEPTTLEELIAEWVNDNADKIRFAAWIRNLTDNQKNALLSALKELPPAKFKSPNSRCEDAPCCGCCD